MCACVHACACVWFIYIIFLILLHQYYIIKNKCIILLCLYFHEILKLFCTGILLLNFVIKPDVHQRCEETKNYREEKKNCL